MALFYSILIALFRALFFPLPISLRWWVITGFGRDEKAYPQLLRWLIPVSNETTMWLIDQLHTRAKEFIWCDVTPGCSFAAT